MGVHGSWLLHLIATGLLVEFAIALPAATVAPPTATHIVSFVHRGRAKAKAIGKHDEFPDFDFEDVRNSVNGTETIFERFVEQLDTSLANNSIAVWQRRRNKSPKVEQSQRLIRTDDSLDTQQNTLHDSNAIFGSNSHHESPTKMRMPSTGNTSADVMWNRNKQSIIGLAPVRHLVNSVRDGALNHTIPHRNHSHHLISADHNNATTSPAIETEEDRIEAEESTEFKLLEVLGSLGGMVWTFFSSLQKLFAASSGNASAASSSSSFGRR